MFELITLICISQLFKINGQLKRHVVNDSKFLEGGLINKLEKLEIIYQNDPNYNFKIPGVKFIKAMTKLKIYFAKQFFGFLLQIKFLGSTFL